MPSRRRPVTGQGEVETGHHLSSVDVGEQTLDRSRGLLHRGLVLEVDGRQRLHDLLADPLTAQILIVGLHGDDQTWWYGKASGDEPAEIGGLAPNLRSLLIVDRTELHYVEHVHPASRTDSLVS